MATKHPQPLTAPLAQRTGAAAQPNKIEQARQALASSSLSVGAPGKPASMPTPLIGGTTVLTIPIRDIEPYEKNPRTDPNECFEDIKESIRLAGLDSIMQVMRMPGSARYTVAKGGNTRLKALKELWEETKDPRFEQVTAQLVNWRGHSAAIADHLKENTLRGAMSFYDKARACLEIQQQIEIETGKKPGVRELVKALKEQYGLSMDAPTLSRNLHVAEHFHSIRLWTNNISVKALIPTYNNLFRLCLKFDKAEPEAHTELEAALERYAAQCSREPTEEGEGHSVRFDVHACAAQMQASVCTFLNLTQYQLDFALAALETVPSATQAELLTTPTPPVATALVGSTSQVVDHDEDDSVDRADDDVSATPAGGFSHEADAGLEATRARAPSGAKTPLQIALELGQQTRAEAQARAQQQGQAGDAFPAGLSGGSSAADGASPDIQSNAAEAAAATATSTAVRPGGGRRRQVATVEDALDAIIDSAARFADLCGVSEECRTSLSLPHGFYMEVPEAELIYPTETHRDARLRVGGWWLAATLARQFDEEHSRLFPSDCLWRAAWVRDVVNGVEPPDLFGAIQGHLGAVMGDDGKIALQLEFVHVVLSDPQRAAAYFELVNLVNQLDQLRNGGAR